MKGERGCCAANAIIERKGSCKTLKSFGCPGVTGLADPLEEINDK